MQSEVNQEENLNTTDFDEHFAKISSYIVDTLHGVPLEMTEDEKEQFRMHESSARDKYLAIMKPYLLMWHSSS